MTRAGLAVMRSGSSNPTFVLDAGQIVQTYPPLPIGCACASCVDPIGCVPAYHVEGLGSVVLLASYKALRDRSWRWRVQNRLTQWWWVHSENVVFQRIKAARARAFGPGHLQEQEVRE